MQHVRCGKLHGKMQRSDEMVVGWRPKGERGSIYIGVRDYINFLQERRMEKTKE